MRESVVFYKSFYDAISELPDELQLEAFRAITEYGLFGREPDGNGVIKAIFSLVKPQIDANNKRYENGRKGGRSADKQTETTQEPKLNQAQTKPEPGENQTHTKEEPNVNVNVNANVNANVNDNVNADMIAQSDDERPSAPEIALPLNDKTEYPVTARQVKEWGELYPAVDVMQELRKMRGWLLSNPKKRKTKRGIGNFVTSWLSREQDRGRAAPKSQSVLADSSKYDFAALEKSALCKVMGGAP